MTKSFTAYNKSSQDELTLRDHLAADRTILAIERTLLAYIRTALALLVVGASMIHFFNSPLIEIFGWIFVAGGMVSVIVGLVRYKKMKERIQQSRTRPSRRPQL